MLPLRRMGPVVKLGDGNLGGKARVLPFLQRLLDASGLNEDLAPHTITVPETWVLTTQVFAEFVGRNRLMDCAEIDDDAEVRRRFLAAKLPERTRETLRVFLKTHKLPLAVRSSALSEDTYHHATAGLYSTYFIPNRGHERFRQLLEAIKLVFASAYYDDVARYMHTHSIPRDDEEMAVALETVVGTEHGQVYYPLAAGVGQSLNYFPMGKMKPTDGVVSLVMGLGSRAVSGTDGMRFCPRYPLVRPYFQQPADILQTAQTVIDAVDLSASTARLSGDEADTIRRVPIEDTESHRTLAEVASVYDEDAEIFYDSLMRDGRRVVTFNRMLRESSIPLPSMLRRLLQVVEEGFGFPIEIEFALDLSGRGRDRHCKLVLLQARPLPAVHRESRVEIPEVPAERVLLRTDLVLGHGKADAIQYVTFIDPARFSLETSDEMAAEVGQINSRLREEGQRYLLLGPGRWGSCNKAVGVPVAYAQIDQALLIAEIATPSLRVEPSQGTHFFHNMVSRDLFYLTVDTRVGHQAALDWLREQPNLADTRLVKLIRHQPGISLRVDAQERVGVVYR